MFALNKKTLWQREKKRKENLTIFARVRFLWFNKDHRI